MTLKSLLKSAIAVGAHRTGLSRIIASRYRGRGAIFALHSVVDDISPYPDQTLRCAADKLAWVLQWLKDEEWDFVSIDDAVRRLRTRDARPFAAFTLDDGFADNLTHVLPVMERFDAPFTVFVATGMITREIDAWWFGLAALVRKQDRITLGGLGWLVGPHLELLRAVADAYAGATGRRLPINGAGAAGAALADAGFPPSTVRGVVLIARTAGLVAHLAEEMERPIGMPLWLEAEHRSSAAAAE